MRNQPLTVERLAELKVGQRVFAQFQGDSYFGPCRRKATVAEIPRLEPPEIVLQFRPEPGEDKECAQYAYAPLRTHEHRHAWREINGEATVLLRIAPAA